MTEEILLSAIEQEASREAQGILGKAHQEERHLLEEAKRQADETEARFVKQREAEFKKRRLRLETQRTLELRQGVTSLKARAVGEALGQAQESFRALQKGSAYETLFKKLLKELTESLGSSGGALVVRVKPGDERLAASAVKGSSLKAEVATDPSMDGGLELSDQEGRVRLRNTFETRVARNRESLIQKLNELLFNDVRL